MIELHWTDVDQVTTVWTDAPPPLRAGLLFRTGRIDETLTMAGHSHLIEHLALTTVSDPAQHHQGYVGGAITGFYTMGRTQDVSIFLASICEALASLPANRLEGEKQILAAEDAGRSYDFRSTLLTWRYGATGYGLIGMPQLGLRNATIEQLHSYSAQRFTKENAVLWLSGPPPADLRLNLPHGIKQPLPELSPIQLNFPSWFVDDACGGVGAGATVPRISVSTIFSAIAANRLREQLRTQHAVSYAPAVFYDHLTTDTAHLVLYADSDMDHREDLATYFGEVFMGLGKIDDSEIESTRQMIIEHRTGALAPPPADLMMIEVHRAASDWIFGREFESLESLDTELMTVTASDVSKFGRDLQAAVMFALPGQAVILPWAGKKAPISVGSAVQGREIRCIDAPIQHERLVHGPDGVSLLRPDGSHLTVRYSELAAALHYDDGGVRLIGSDATWLTIEPTLWRDGQNLCRKILEQVPADLRLAQAPRSADAIPRPRTTAWQRLRAFLFQK